MRDIYFDLDGTLTDPFEGITLSIQHALNAMNAHVPTQKELGRFIGPPLRVGFGKLLGTEDPAQVARAIEIYRERFSVVGLFENTVYTGVLPMLEALSRKGHRIFMATSKPRVFAERIAEHFRFAHYFTQIFGSELDGRFDDKRELLAHALATHPPTNGQPIMIGDREFDMQGAHANKLIAVGVSYGYGSRDELVEARADYICDSPAEVTDRISQILS